MLALQRRKTMIRRYGIQCKSVISVIVFFQPIFAKSFSWGKDIAYDLLTTPETLDDKLYDERTRYVVGEKTILFFGTLKRVLWLACIIYFFVVNFEGFYYNQKFISVDEKSGNCEVRLSTFPLIPYEFHRIISRKFHEHGQLVICWQISTVIGKGKLIFFQILRIYNSKYSIYL